MVLASTLSSPPPATASRKSDSPFFLLPCMLATKAMLFSHQLRLPTMY